jgi:hypothetical protein
MSLSIDNLKKDDNKKWKKVADYLLYTGLPAINVFLLAIQPYSQEFTIWALAVSNLIIGLFKGVTKFTEEPIQTT